MIGFCRSRAAQGSVIDSKCDRYLTLINEYTRKGLVEQMRHHSCDMPGLTPNRILICGISNKRDRPESRIVYVGSKSGIIFMRLGLRKTAQGFASSWG